jgi:hypothetical protein
VQVARRQDVLADVAEALARCYVNVAIVAPGPTWTVDRYR